MAGVNEDKIVEAHGTFYTSHCMKCRKDYTFEWMKGMLSFCLCSFKHAQVLSFVICYLSLTLNAERIDVLSNLLFAVYACDI